MTKPVMVTATIVYQPACHNTLMSRTARVDVGDEIYHVINRATNGRFQIFNTDEDYQRKGRILLYSRI